MVKDNPEATGKITTNKGFLQLKHPTDKVSDQSGIYSKSPKVANAVIRVLLWHTPKIKSCDFTCGTAATVAQ
jgi:hypothetical protein